MSRNKTKPFDTKTAVEHIESNTPKTKTVLIPPGMTFEQHVDETGRQGMAWLQVFQALHFLEENPLVTPSKAAMDFVRIAKQLASSASLAANAEEAFRPLDDLLPNGQLGNRSRAAHRLSAQGERKLSAADKRNIKRIYAERVRNGEKYGAIKALAARFDVSRTTIATTITSERSSK